jgi:hypothetical protein
VNVLTISANGQNSCLMLDKLCGLQEMVEKKKSKGILTIGAIGVVIALLKLLCDISLIGWSLSQTHSWSSYIIYLMMVIFTLLVLISAIYIIKLRNWARNLLILLLPLFILHDISQYAFTHSAGNLSSFARLVIFIFSAFGKPFIAFVPAYVNNFLGFSIYIYIIFTILYLANAEVKMPFK